MDIWFMSDETLVVNGGAGDKVKIKHLEEEISGHESDKHASSSIAARASELETEVSRLQHDLISSLSDGQEANAKISEFEAKDVKKEEKMNVIENERNLLLEKLKESEEKFREFETEKARKIEFLMNKISEFETKVSEKEERISYLVEKLKESEVNERVKSDKVNALMDKIAALMREKANKDDKIAELTFKNMKVNEMEKKLDQLQKEILSKENVVDSTTTNKNGIVSKVDWPVVAVSAGAVATLGLVYFRHAKF